MGKEDIRVSRAVRAIKWGGGLLVVAVNGYLAYRFSTAYEDGQLRGEALHEEREAKRKAAGGKKEGPKSLVPEELQPEYVEKQVRKYKQMALEEKKQKKV